MTAEAPIPQEQEPHVKSNFVEMLEARWDQGFSVCVGLDSEYAKLPEHIRNAYDNKGDAVIAFNRAIVDSTAQFAASFKPNIAFYEPLEEDGVRAYRETIQYIKENHPDVPVIADAKRADIGNTNKGYAEAIFDKYGADAITVNPYFGEEALRPFLERSDKGIVVLARTSNPGAAELQNKEVILSEKEYDELVHGPVSSSGEEFEESIQQEYLYSGEANDLSEGGTLDQGKIEIIRRMPMYLQVALRVANHWNKEGNCALVAGATAPEELRRIREAVGDLPILIPGIGKQGGDLEKTALNGQNSRKQGMIINSSSGIIFASSGEDFAEAAAREAVKINQGVQETLAA